MRTDASPRFATRPCRRDRRTPTGSSEAAFDMRTDASPRFTTRPAAAAGERRQPLERTSPCASALPQNTAAESANHTDASPALPRGHAAAAGENRPIGTNKRGFQRPRARHLCFATRPCRRDRRTPTIARAHIALRAATRFGAPAEHRSGIGETAFAGDESAPFEMRMDAHTACLAVFFRAGQV